MPDATIALNDLYKNHSGDNSNKPPPAMWNMKGRPVNMHAEDLVSISSTLANDTTIDLDVLGNKRCRGELFKSFVMVRSVTAMGDKSFKKQGNVGSTIQGATTVL